MKTQIWPELILHILRLEVKHWVQHNEKLRVKSTNASHLEGGILMLKLLAKVAEKYAKSTNTACVIWLAWHQPKMPASLVKKD